MGRWFALVVAMLVGLAGAAAADSWMPFADCRVGSPDGRRYVVVRKAGFAKIRFELCERAVGQPPLEDATDDAFDRILHPERVRSVARDPQDLVIARGVVRHVPCYVVVLNDGGFVLIENHGGVGRGHVVTFVNDRGRVRTRKTLCDLYGGVPDGSSFSVSSIWWRRAFWVDQRRRSIVFVSRRDAIREVLLETGTVRTPRPLDFVAWCVSGETANRCEAFEVASRFADPVVVPTAAAIADNPGEPVAVRLRAAIVLARAGRSSSRFAAMFIDAVNAKHGAANRRYAATHLVRIAGIDAIPHLERLFREGSDSCLNRVAWCAFERQGPEVSAAAIALLDGKLRSAAGKSRVGDWLRKALADCRANVTRDWKRPASK